MGSFDVALDEEHVQFDAFVEEHRNALEVILDGLTSHAGRASWSRELMQAASAATLCE